MATLTVVCIWDASFKMVESKKTLKEETILHNNENDYNKLTFMMHLFK